jgi:hypothetical protein
MMTFCINIQYDPQHNYEKNTTFSTLILSIMTQDGLMLNVNCAECRVFLYNAAYR